MQSERVRQPLPPLSVEISMLLFSWLFCLICFYLLDPPDEPPLRVAPLLPPPLKPLLELPVLKLEVRVWEGCDELLL